MRQRVALAIAMICEPRLLFADEPTTALDVSVQARILRQLAQIRDRGVGLLLVSHDLGVVAGLADRVAVMYAGRVVEQGLTERIFAAPAHPYTHALLAAVPHLRGDVGARLPAISGTPPRPGEVRSGCAFAPRCPRAATACVETSPRLLAIGDEEGAVACHRPRTSLPEPA
jgi:oligopeptide/dipeptide ABC transporter ATP-binding protein